MIIKVWIQILPIRLKMINKSVDPDLVNPYENDNKSVDPDLVNLFSKNYNKSVDPDLVNPSENDL